MQTLKHLYIDSFILWAYCYLTLLMNLSLLETIRTDTSRLRWVSWWVKSHSISSSRTDMTWLPQGGDLTSLCLPPSFPLTLSLSFLAVFPQPVWNVISLQYLWFFLNLCFLAFFLHSSALSRQCYDRAWATGALGSWLVSTYSDQKCVYGPEMQWVWTTFEYTLWSRFAQNW